jgi:hypothetical protein
LNTKLSRIDFCAMIPATQKNRNSFLLTNP